MSERKALPSVTPLTLILNLPVSKKKIKYRPFVVKERNALLLAQQSQDEEVILETLVSVLESCTKGELNAKELPLADLAYFFLQLRIASSGNEIKFKTSCENCEEEILINFNLDVVGVKGKTDGKIVFDNGVGVILRHVNINDALENKKYKDEPIDFIRTLITSIFDSETVYDIAEYTKEELYAWIEELDEKALKKIEEFIVDMPDIHHDMIYDCPQCKHHHTRELRGLQNFFRLSSS